MFRSRWRAFRVWVKLEDRAKQVVAMVLFTEADTAGQGNPGT